MLANTLFAFAGVKMLASEVEESLEYTDEAIRLADTVGEPGIRSAKRISADAYGYLGHIGVALAMVDEGIELVGNDADLGAEHLGYSP